MRTTHKIIILMVTVFAGFFVACEEELPSANRVNGENFIGEWTGVQKDTLERDGTLTGNVLNEVLSIRRESEKDTFNLISTETLLPIKSGTWSVVTVSDPEGNHPQAYILRLAVWNKNKFDMQTYSVNSVDGERLVIQEAYGDNGRRVITSTYTK